MQVKVLIATTLLLWFTNVFMPSSLSCRLFSLKLQVFVSSFSIPLPKRDAQKKEVYRESTQKRETGWAFLYILTQFLVTLEAVFLWISLCFSLCSSLLRGLKKETSLREKEETFVCLHLLPFSSFSFSFLSFPLTALLFRGTSSVFSSTPSSSFLNYYLSLKYSRQDNSHTGCIIMRNPYHLLLSFSEFVEKTCASLLKEGLTRFLFLLLLPYFFFFFVFWFFAGRSQWRSSWTYSTSFSCFSLSHESECPPATSFCQEKREKSTGCYTRKASSGLDLALNFQVICFGFRLQRILVSHVQDSLPLFPVCPSLLEESIEGRENLVFSSSLMSLKL